MLHKNYTQTLFDYEISKGKLPEELCNNELLDASLLCVYRVATCDGKCRGGDHIIEALTGRGFNLASSSIILCSIGYYDEALNLIRSLGELSNLLAYLSLYPEEYPKWVTATKSERLKRYSPAKIRNKIADKKIFSPPMDDETYSNLCETATHVTGNTKPNVQSFNNIGNVAGFSHDSGNEKVVGLLTNAMLNLATLVTCMTGRQDLFSQISELIDDKVKND